LSKRIKVKFSAEVAVTSGQLKLSSMVPPWMLSKKSTLTSTAVMIVGHPGHRSVPLVVVPEVEGEGAVDEAARHASPAVPNLVLNCAIRKKAK
jgi:hypothetical protein